MVHNIVADNINQALVDGVWHLKLNGISSNSRNGPVVVAPTPVAITYKCPWQRVLFSPVRNANPFFHFFESLWMLAGRRDVEFLAQFAPRMKTFSDDGVTLNGAYGYRWRNSPIGDQIQEVIEHLKKNPDSRREVIAMWSPSDLIKEGSKDLPCNVVIFVDIRNNKLNITVCNRSNDLWWGACGANAVHMSFLQEFIALAVGVEIGTYTQFSNNFHIYTELYDGGKVLESPGSLEFEGPYPGPHTPIMSTPYKHYLREVSNFLDNRGTPQDPFLIETATPMLASWRAYRKGEEIDAIIMAEGIEAEDWRKACVEWLYRRGEKK